MITQHDKLGMRTEGKAYRRYLEAGLLEEIDLNYIRDIRKYWKEKFNKDVDPTLAMAFANLSGKKDLRVIPPLVMWNDIIPYFNDKRMMRAYSEKNIYDRLINLPNSVENIVKRIRGNYYDINNNSITNKQVMNILLNTEKSYIIKPSDTDNGIGIGKIVVQNSNLAIGSKIVTLEDLEVKYGSNFSIQKVIEQSDTMAEPHPESVNTLRMVTLRFKGEIHYLLTFARFGANKSVNDNAGSGGVCLGVSDDGEFLKVAIDAQAKTYTHHPTTNFDFNKMDKIPNFDKFKDYVIEGHKKILHHDFVSWDIAVDTNENPVFIEANFRGATWLYHLASQQPIFGDLTEEVIDFLQMEFEGKKKRNVRLSSSERNKIRRKNRKIKNQSKSIENLEKVNKEIQEKNKYLLNEIKDIKTSKSWRLTKPLRKINSKFK